MFSHKRYEEIRDQTYANVNKLGQLKGGEYAGDDDRLANFRRNGMALGVGQELVWALYYNKHHDAVMQYVQDRRNGTSRERAEKLSGRIDDMVTYLILFKCILEENGDA